MKIKLKYTCLDELRAYYALTCFKGITADVGAVNTLEKFSKYILKDLSEKIAKKILASHFNNSQKGSISITKAELLAIDLNFEITVYSDYISAVYRKNIFPILNQIA